MRTQELGWSSTRTSRVRCLALAVACLAVVAGVGPSYAADQKKVRDKIVEMNKKALLSYEAKEYAPARDILVKALKEAKQAGLEDDKMTARTHLHLGAVYWVGFQNQAMALENFTAAKKIRPDIQLTPSIETPDLKSVFDLAVVEPEPEPTPEPSKPSKPLPTPTPEPTLAGSSEPDLPSTMSSPLMCSTPEESPPGKELSIRCALKPGIRAASVQLHYRAPGAEAYQSLPMHRTAKGWYLATVPGRAMQGSSIQVFYDARDASDNQLASNGQEDSPSVIQIRKKSGGARGGGARGVGVAEGDPLAGIKEEQELERYEASLHRRRQGAIWIAMGGGTGWGYAPAGGLEWAKTRDKKPIQVGAVGTTTGLFHIVPELGYMWTDNFSISLQMRLEYIRQDQITTASNLTGAPTQWAPAFFLRGLWFFGNNLQFVTGPSLGGGYVRFPIKPQIVRTYVDQNGDTKPDPDWTIAKTDTRPMGTVLLGGSAGLVYHVSRYFGFAAEGRVLLGFPNFGFALEGNFSVFLAFGGRSGRVHAAEEGEGEGEGEGETGAIRDSPEPEESSPSSSDEYEEE